MKRFVLVLVLISLSAPGAGATTAPSDGGGMPGWYSEGINRDRNFLRLEHAWIQKAQHARAARERYIAERGFYSMDMATPAELQQMAVSGTFRIPVLCAKFSNTGPDPWPVAGLENKLFNGPGQPQTLADFYSEISYGNVTVSGDVFGWATVSQPDTVYEGGPGDNGFPPGGSVGTYLVETLDLLDPSVDFSLYDNDGPDNIPNSGDDDGWVDFVAFVHPEMGAECGGLPINFWSHRWTLSGAAGSAYTTNDPRAGGGMIRINDYVLQPAFNCDNSTMIDIGVFAHEFGHAFGLPDLYDTNGGSQGIGHWGLMGAGNWNTPDWPAHMSPWSKNELGWVNVVRVGSRLQTYVLGNTETGNTIYRLDTMDLRWRRMADCAIAGGYSMRCGLLTPEGNARNWAGGDGYGNGWRERLTHDFTYNGIGPVTFQYDFTCYSEPGYDFTRVRIDVGGTVNTLAVYDGIDAGTAVLDLTPYLSGPTGYTLSFEFESDPAWSDRDGSFTGSCGPFVIDNVSVVGGGENHSADFEQREDGWFPDMSSPEEYFIAENRQPVGTDVDIHGGGGIVLWHVNQDVTRTGQAGNTGGSTNTRPRGVMPEQADGLGNLEMGTNRGDSGDAFPGVTANTTFDNASVPSSRSYTGLVNNVRVVNISPNPADGSPMTADMSAGWPDVSVAQCTPGSGDNNQVVSLEITGAWMDPGTTVGLFDGNTMIAAGNYAYDGYDRLTCDVDLNGAQPGQWDVIVTNSTGGTGVKPAGITVNGTATGVDRPAPTQTALRQNYPNPFNPATVIPFDLKDDVRATLRIYNVRGQMVRTLVDGRPGIGSHTATWDGRNDAGAAVGSGVYFYRLEAGSFREVRKLTLLK